MVFSFALSLGSSGGSLEILFLLLASPLLLVLICRARLLLAALLQASNLATGGNHLLQAQFTALLGLALSLGEKLAFLAELLLLFALLLLLTLTSLGTLLLFLFIEKLLLGRSSLLFRCNALLLLTLLSKKLLLLLESC